MIQTIVGVFVGVLVGSTLGAFVGYKITRRLLLKDEAVKGLLRKLNLADISKEGGLNGKNDN